MPGSLPFVAQACLASFIQNRSYVTKRSGGISLSYVAFILLSYTAYPRHQCAVYFSVYLVVYPLCTFCIPFVYF